MSDPALHPREGDEPDGLETPDALDLPGEMGDEEDVGIVDPADEIDWTPPGASDDSDADDLPIGDVEVEDDDEEDSSSESLSIDFGESDGLIADEALVASGDDPPTLLDEDDEIDVTEAHDADDGGIEGTTEDIGEGIDEAALPGLDADEEGAFDLGDLMRELTAAGLGREGDGPPWIARDEWTTSDAFDDVVAEGGRVIAVGAELVVLEPGARSVRRSRLPAPAARVAMSGPTVVVASGETVTLATPAADVPKAPLLLFEGSTPLSGSSAHGSSHAVRALGIAAGRVWVVAGDELWVAASPPSTAKRVRASGAVDIAVGGTSLFLLSIEGERLSLERYRGDDGDWHRLAIGEMPAAPARLALSTSGEALAVTTADTIAVSWNGGATFQVAPTPGLVAACFGGADGQTLFVLTSLEGEASLRAVTSAGVEDIAVHHDRFNTVTGDVRLAWCDAREALFVVGAAGSLAIGPRRTH